MIFPTLDLSNPEKAARRKWKYEDPKFDCAANGSSRHVMSSCNIALEIEPIQQAAARKHYQPHSGFSSHANVVISHATFSIASPRTRKVWAKRLKYGTARSRSGIRLGKV